MPVVLKAQQDPQLSWFLMGVTAPALTQSTLSAAVLLWYLKGLAVRVLQHTAMLEACLQLWTRLLCFRRLACCELQLRDPHLNSPPVVGCRPNRVARNSSGVKSANWFTAIWRASSDQHSRPGLESAGWG